MVCLNCNSADPGPGPFCMSCGARLPISATPQSPPPTAGGWYGSPATPVNQMGSDGIIPLNIWGPFAGYGTRGRHVSWLINDQGEYADALCDHVARRFNRRMIPQAMVQPVHLVRQGILVDARPYFLIRRGLTTAGLYIARFGQDLFVSQVTYFKGPISSIRVLLAIIALLFVLIYPYLVSGTAGQIGIGLGGISGNPGSLALLLCYLGPVYLFAWLALGILVVFSGYKWLTEKDALAALRVPPNEFDIDDTVALEKSVEQTVREALDEVGLEQRLMPPAAEYGLRRRLI